ncbi:MAG: four helix bundle protein [Bacteroidota bacterium]
MGTYRDLIAWQKSHELVLHVYELSKQFPSDERFALTDQLRRAVLSVPTNVVEGHGSGSEGLFRHHLTIARGSLAETRYLLHAATDLKYMTLAQYDVAEAIASQASRLLTRLHQSLKP